MNKILRNIKFSQTVNWSIWHTTYVWRITDISLSFQGTAVMQVNRVDLTWSDVEATTVVYSPGLSWASAEAGKM